MGGLASSTRKWYVEQILKILKERKQASAKAIILELRRLDNKRYPIQEERILAFLKYLRAIGKVKYIPTEDRRKYPSKWVYVGK